MPIEADRAPLTSASPAPGGAGSDKPRLLIVTHQYFNLGGVELQTQLLARGLGNRYEVTVAVPDRKAGRILRIAPDGRILQSFSAASVAFPATPYDEPAANGAFAGILAQCRPEIVHFQHFLHWPLSVIDQALGSGARVVVSFHDFYAITPAYTMIGAHDPEQTFTAEYSRTVFGADLTAYLRQRREIIHRSMGRVHARVGVSAFVTRVLLAIYPLEYQVIEPGIVPFVPPPVRPDMTALRFGYLGKMVPQKGWAQLVEAFALVRSRHPEVELRLYGVPTPATSAGATLPTGVSYRGPYGPGDLARIIGEFDVGVVPSVFPEMYAIVLSELWHAGRPVAASQIGAMADRVVNDVNGRTFPPGDIGAMARTLEGFIEPPRAWRTWTLPRVRTVALLTDDHDALYRSLLSRSSSSL
jgi:glycosyltransferase involved in cell wall biosynthesis